MQIKRIIMQPNFIYGKEFAEIVVLFVFKHKYMYHNCHSPGCDIKYQWLN